MTKIVLKDGTEEYLSPSAAREKVLSGEASYAQAIPEYSTRRMTAEPVKAKRKRRTKAEMEADEAAEPVADETDDSETE